MENIDKKFLGILSPYFKDSFLEYHNQNRVFRVNYYITPYNNSLHVAFIYNKNGRIGIKEVQIFQKFLNEINIHASKSKLDHTTLLDTNSLFFSRKLLPHLHSYEWALRKLIYLLSPTYFSNNWVEESISQEIIATIKQKQKQAKGKYDLKNLLQWIDLYDFEEYLFGENYILVKQEQEKNIIRYKEMTQDQLLNLFQNNSYTISDSYSLWSEVFSKYIDVKQEEIQSDMGLIREGRNIVSHNKEIEMPLYQELTKKLKKYTKQLEKAFQKILAGDIASEDINDMSDDFKGYIGNHFGNIDSTRSALRGIQETMSAQPNWLKGMGLSETNRSALRGIQETMSAQPNWLKGMGLSETNRSALRGIQETMSAQPNWLKGMGLSETNRSALRGIQETMFAQPNWLKGMRLSETNRSALRGIQETMFAQPNWLKGMGLSETNRSALKGIQENISAQSNWTKGMGLSNSNKLALKSLQETMFTQNSFPQGIDERQVKEYKKDNSNNWE
jgi:hypothetical protein